MELDKIKSFLELKNYDILSCKNVKNITFIGSGFFSFAYSFESNNIPYVLRIGTSLKAFDKDDFAYINFSNNLNNIPKVLEKGKINDKFYCITEKIAGKEISSLDTDSLKKVLPSIMENHLKIIQINTDKFSNFGYINLLTYKGNSLSWHDFITKIDVWLKTILIPTNVKYQDWDKLFDKKDFDKPFFDKCYQELIKLAKFLPEKKFIVHGDFGNSNMLCENNKVTGIIDWAEFMVGDFLYDLAYMDYYNDKISYKDEFKAFYIKNNINISFYDERIRCYQIYMTLLSMFIYFNRNMEKEFIEELDMMKNKILIL